MCTTAEENRAEAAETEPVTPTHGRTGHRMEDGLRTWRGNAVLCSLPTQTVMM